MDETYYYKRTHVNTVQELINRAAESYPHESYCKYLVDGEIFAKTYGEMKEDIQRIETYISRIGVKHIGLLGATSYTWLSVLMACLHFGVPVVPLDALLPEDDLAYLIEHADVDLLICDKKFQGLSRKLGTGNKCGTICYLDVDGEGSLSFELDKQADTPYIEPCTVDKNALALIVYTSGTEGRTKGVMLSQGNLAAASHYGASVVETIPDSHSLVLLPNNHVYTITNTFLTAFYFGTCLCLNDSIYNTFINLKKYKVNRLVAVPAVIRMIKIEIDNQLKGIGIRSLETLPLERRTKIAERIKPKLGNVRTIVCGGAPLDPAYVNFFKLLDIQLQAGYGMTETAAVISSQVENRIDYNRARSVGKPGVCCKLKIVNGEIWVSGENVMLGYYKDPECTAEILTEDGWLKTGDIGYLDKEGFLYIIGRFKNLIILGNGENVSPEELEMLFIDCEHIQDIIVSGDTDLDVIQAEVYPAAASVHALGLAETKALINQEINDKNQGLPIYKQIKLVIFKDKSFEKTTSMKIKRKIS